MEFFLSKFRAKSKGQVVTGMVGMALGVSSHLMWGRQGGMDILIAFRMETTVHAEIGWGFPDSPSKKHSAYNMASLIM